MSSSKQTQDGAGVAEEIARECVGVRVRMLSRAMTRIYDDRLRPHGIKFSQMNILTAVSLQGPIQPMDVARILSMEKSTLSRNLKVMQDNGWIEIVAGETGNTRVLSVTRKGTKLLRATLPAWREAQARVSSMLGERTTAALLSAGDRLMRSEAS